MVLKVDLTQHEKELPQKAPEKEVKIPKIKFFRRIKNKFRKWQADFAKKPLSHKMILTIISISVTGLAAIALIYGFIILTSPPHQPLDTSFKLLEVQSQKEHLFSQNLPSPPDVKDQENPINGEFYTKEEFESLQKKKPLLVIIENHLDARPQAGLSKAALVYETLVESGITRLLAVFWGNDAEKVGPIRSVRTYYLDWVAEYDDPPLVHIGFAGYAPDEAVKDPEADAISYMKKYVIKSFSWYGRKVFWRDYDKFHSGIAWEHVAYSETQTLWEDAETMGWVGPAQFDSLNFKKDALKEQRALTQEIEIKFLNLGSETYKVKWVYDKDSNTYKRYLAAQPHVDENTDKQIAAKNIIIQHCAYRPTGDKNGRIVFTTIDEGTAQIFRDGKLQEGTWKKSSRTSRTKFYDSESNEIELNRGQIWIEIVPVQGTTELSSITIK